MLFFIEKPSTYATCYLIELCQIVVTLSEISYSHDQDHLHISTTCYDSTLEVRKKSIHPQNKTPSPCMTPLSQKYVKDMGYAKRK